MSRESYVPFPAGSPGAALFGTPPVGRNLLGQSPASRLGLLVERTAEALDRHDAGRRSAAAYAAADRLHAAARGETITAILRDLYEGAS